MHANRSAAALALVLTLAGCGGAAEQPEAPAARAEAATAAKPAPLPLPADPAKRDPAASRVDLATLTGTWRVSAVVPGEGVQAFVRDDPAYFGRELAISPERLAWAPGGPAGAATVQDVCAGPVTQRQAGAAAATYIKTYRAQLDALRLTEPDVNAVECQDGNWGPEAAGGAILFAGADGTLAMSWYDGIVLKLTR